MIAFKTFKEVKKAPPSPLKTPERPMTSRKTPTLKKSAIKSKPSSVPRKVSHAKSMNQFAMLEELKQNSVSLIEGVEKLRRIVAFSNYRPCFEIIKIIFYIERSKIRSFVQLKTLYKAWEG